MPIRQRKNKELLYLQIAKAIQGQIGSGVLKVGDKLPSIRMICRQQGVSMSTVQLAYHELEKKALIESRPQSGYYVSNSLRRRLELPGTSKPQSISNIGRSIDFVQNDFDVATQKDMILFSRGVPSPELLPVAKLNKCLMGAMRELPDSGISYESLQGNENLRRQIARWSLSWKGNLSENDIITTAGCMTAVSYCLMALTKPGDTIAVESPCFYVTLQLAQSLGLKILELPTSPTTGVDLDALKVILSRKKIALCLFVSNFSNPLGSMMPDEHKRAAVQLLERYNVPLLEDDIYGDLYFGDSRPTCCKSYDESGMVLLCSSVSKTLAPGYRVGWVAAGKFQPAISKIKAFHSLFNPSLPHAVIAAFLENGRYEAHLRKLRQTLHTNYLQYVRVIGESFPEGTKISRPQGGISVWVELPKRIDVVELNQMTLRSKVSVSPGSLFTMQDQFHNCMRLGYGMLWTKRVENGLQLIGRLAKAEMK